jgi:hypothetical protein
MTKKPAGRIRRALGLVSKQERAEALAPRHDGHARIDPPAAESFAHLEDEADHSGYRYWRS